jgi:hypothetical protein
VDIGDTGLMIEILRDLTGTTTTTGSLGGAGGVDTVERETSTANHVSIKKIRYLVKNNHFQKRFPSSYSWLG